MIIWKKRQFTEDIDFAMIHVPVPIPSRGHFKVTIIPDEIANRHSGISYADELRDAIGIVARRHPRELAVDWLNDEAAGYLYEDAPEPEVEFWQSFGEVLFVYLPTPAYVFATKLMASRPKDSGDIQELAKLLDIKNRAQAKALVDRFITPDAQEFYEIEDNLDLFS